MISLTVATLRKDFDTGPVSISLSNWLVVGLLVGVCLLGVQAYFEYRKRTYDPTWAFKFDDILNGPEMKRARSKAAKVLKDHRGNLGRTEQELSDIDDVLDFFDQLGFYEHGDQITPEVVHQTFYHWIQGYYQTSRDYIEACQENEPTKWEYIAELFETTHEIEIEKSRGKETKALSEAQISTFLDAEINMFPEKQLSS